MRIRDTTAADARAIAEVYVRSWQAAYRGLMPDDLLDSLSVENPEQEWGSWLASPAPRQGCLVAEEDGKVVGFVRFGSSRDEDAAEDAGEVYAIYVVPEAFGTGTGRELFAHANRILRERGFTAATLWVLEANERARRFYEAAGWRPDGAITTERIDCLRLPTVRYGVELG